jgi:DNA-binding GntR family transcriptional regulator
VPRSTTLSNAIRPPSLHEEVASRLRSLIFERRLSPGSWIDELALAREWGVSRTPLREALKVLAVEGLVSAHPGRGCQVAEVSEEDAAQLFPVMALLESRCALEAVQRASDDDVRGLQMLHDELERCAALGDIESYYRANHVFHSRVQELADNPWLGRATRELRKFMRLLRGRQLHWPGRMAASIAEHRAFMQAFARRDAHAASTIMRDHLMAQLAALQALRAQEQLDAKLRAVDAVHPQDSAATESHH